MGIFHGCCPLLLFTNFTPNTFIPMNLKNSSFFTLLLVLLLAACGQETPADQNLGSAPDSSAVAETPPPTEEAPEAQDKPYSIKPNSFAGIKIGDALTETPNLTKGIMQTGEADFEVYYIKSEEGEDLGHIYEDYKDKTLVGEIIVTTEKAQTDAGAKVGMTYGELEKILTDFQVHGSEIEARTHVEDGTFSYRLDEPHVEYDLDKSAISKDAKIVSITVTGKPE